MAIISMPGSAELLIIAVMLLYFFFLISTGISIIRREDMSLTNRLLWIVILLIAPLIGIILYQVYSRPLSR